MTITYQDLQFDRVDRMQKALRVSGIGIADLAERIGVNRNTIGSWINGRNEPSRASVKLFALECGVSYEWLELGVDPGEESRLRESNSRPFHYKVNFAHQSLSDDLQNRPCPVCGAPLVWGVCTAVHAGDLALAA